VTEEQRNPFGDSSKNFVFFPSLSHKKGVHRIVRGLESNCGLILLTGEIGIGKTSLARYIQTTLADRFVFVELGNPYQTPLEQMVYCCEQFGLEVDGLSTIHDCVGRLEEHFRSLLEQERRPVIVFDESHLLTKRHMSLIHILSNLRANDDPLVQILIVGQLEILDLLAAEGMEALNQRIGVRCELSPLTLEDTDKYIHFKLERGGKLGPATFSRDAVKAIWKECGGLPRLINHVCAHALDGLMFRETNIVSPSVVEEVFQDSVYSGLFQARSRPQPSASAKKQWLAPAVVAFVVMLGIGAWLMWGQEGVERPLMPTDHEVVVEPQRDSPEVSTESVKPVEPVAENPPTVPDGAAAKDVGVQGQTKIADIPPEALRVTPPVPEPAIESETPAEDAPEVVIVVEEGDGESGRPEETIRLDIGEDSLKSPLDESAPVEPDDAVSLDQPLDGDIHPVIGNFVIGAIAWNEESAASIAVVNSQLIHEGEVVDGAQVMNIGQDYVLFFYEGQVFKRTIAR